MKQEKSKQLFHRAMQVMPGGVNSPVRAFRAVGGQPVLIASGQGCRMTDVDGNEYIDFVASWGPLILGHAHPEVVRAVQESASRGTTFGASTPLEIELAELIRKAFPSMQFLRLVSSGTEATMSALRVARGFTGRRNIIKFEGCYHGHHDSLLTSAGSGVATFDLPDSAGVPESYSQNTISLPFNDLTALHNLPDEILQDTAAVILEPVAANMGLVLPLTGFLEGLKEFTTKVGILLIFDEVITGFRLCFGGAQNFYGVEPDLTCLGKIVGGGMPLAAYGGRAEIMQTVAPLGPVYQAGTLSGNPVAVSAGLAALRHLESEERYPELNAISEEFFGDLQDILKRKAVPASLSVLGSMFTLFYRPEAPGNFRQAKESDTSRYATVFWNLLENGVYVAPSQFETCFVGMAHSKEDLNQALQAFEKSV